MERAPILYLSHCVPNPPDKGERIRAYHEVRHLSQRFEVHLCCFAKTPAEVNAALGLEQWCRSVHVERLHTGLALARGAMYLTAGMSLTASYYSSGPLRRHVDTVVRQFSPVATVAYSVVMAQYAPNGIPLLLDMVDVDSEKWFQYARMRRPGFLYALEARRLRNFERRWSAVARRTLLTTAEECRIFRDRVLDAPGTAVENGIDGSFFDPAATTPLPELSGRRYVIFAGAMNYPPNIDAASWFAREALPVMRATDPQFEFIIAGQSPAAAVKRLAALDGVTVTGYLPDMRPYVAGAVAAVVPLRLARGIQNKVLEALAMGKPVLASPAIARTFGGDPPPGMVVCDMAEDYSSAALGIAARGFSASPETIRAATVERFRWERSMALLERELVAAANLQVR